MIFLLLNIYEILDSQSVLFSHIIILGALIFGFTYIINKNYSFQKKSENKRDIKCCIKIVKLLAKSYNIEIFMFDEYARILYILKKGVFIKTEIDLSQLEKDIHPEDKESYFKDYEDIISCRKDCIISNIRIFNTNENIYRHYEYVIIPIEINSKGRVCKYMYSRKDVTEEKKEIEIKEKDIQSFNLALKSAGLVRWQYEYISHTLIIKDSNFVEYKYNDDELGAIFRDDDVVRFFDYIDRVKNYNNETITLNIKLNNKYFPFEVNSLLYKDDDSIIIYGIMRNISEVFKYKREITELKDNMALGLEAGDISVWQYNIENKLFIFIQGDQDYTKNIYFDEFAKIIHPDDLSLFKVSFEELINGTKKKISFKYRLKIKNTWQWYLSSIIAVRDENNVTSLTGTKKNITEDVLSKTMLEDANKKLSESYFELSKNEKLLQSILNKIPVPIYIKDPEIQKHIYINDEAVKIFNLKLNSFTKDILNSDEALRHKLIDEEIIRTGNEYTGTEINKMYNGEVIESYVRKILIEQNNKKQILTVRLNLNEQRKGIIANKLLTASLSSIKAYTWSYDTRSNSIIYRDTYLNTNNININFFDSIDKKLTIIHKGDRKRYYDIINRYLQEGSGSFSVTYRTDVEKKDCFQWWESRCVVETIYDKGLSYVYIYGIDINIDYQKRSELNLERSKKKLKSVIKQNELILNNNASAMIYLNSDFQVQWSNAELIFSHEELAKFYRSGVFCYKVKGLSEPCFLCPVKEALKTHSISSKEIKIKNDFYEVIAIPVYKGDECEGVVLRVDRITERKHLIEDLKNAKIKAEESDKLKMAFLANMSHEIRTPLNAIIGFSDLIMNDLPDTERDEYKGIIKSNSNLLLRLIGDILDMSKIEAGTLKYKVEQFDIITLFNELVTGAIRQCSEKDLKLISETDIDSLMLTHDRNRVTQIIGNFISNAIKYTDKGYIKLTLNYEDEGILISVKDTGIGIDKSLHPFVFKRFEKLDSFATGTGLGLAICKSIMDDTGGKIGFKSEKNEGSTFYAWFPLEIKNSNGKIKKSPYYLNN